MKIEDLKLSELVEIGVQRMFALRRLEPAHPKETAGMIKAVEDIMVEIKTKVEIMQNKGS